MKIRKRLLFLLQRRSRAGDDILLISCVSVKSFFISSGHLGILLLMKNKKAGSKKPANAPKTKNADYPIKWKNQRAITFG